MADTDPVGYTLMVAGRRTGKTSFLRLLLDTSDVASSVSRDQLASIAKFVQGSSGHTSHVRTVSIDIDLAPPELDDEHPLTLTLIDTPSLDFDDKDASERALQDILLHVESRLAESLDDERKAYHGDHHVHLCVYFLDPNHIVPPSVPAPPAPLVPRARTNSLSTHESEPVILDPPVTSNPVLCRPILPAADIAAIRRLSARVNVLPVVACADSLTTERLITVKMAIRRDLAEAGIGFGIFDLDIPLYEQIEAKGHKAEAGYMKHLNGATSPPLAQNLLRLPFSLISPDQYSHSDGIAHEPLSRNALMHQYAPTKHLAPKARPGPKVVPGRYLRTYRWGALDVLDGNHCEFLHLRGAIFHHMETLQKYTREYLFEKFKAEVQPPPPPAPVRAAPPAAPVARLPPIRGSRPILAIDTAPSHANQNQTPSGHAPLPAPRAAVALNGTGELPSAPIVTMHELPEKTATTSARSQRQRAKKITVACNFCRSRKLKCDGGRPACTQCSKRSNACDYTASNKRRAVGGGGGGGKRRAYGVGSESDEGESVESSEPQAPSQSPELPPSSAPHSRRSSNVSMLLAEPLPPLSAAVDPRQQQHEPSAVLPPITLAVPPGSRRPSLNTELPPIATLSAPPGPLDDGPAPPSAAAYGGTNKEQEPASRRRPASVAPSRSGRGGGGSKIVACNFCRARKTRCDGAHPTCGSCSRRSLRCNYVNDPAAQAHKVRSKSISGTPPDASASVSSRSSPASSSAPVTLVAGEIGSGRRFSELDADMAPQPAKKMRLAPELSAPSIAVLSGP
ncbi:hypothetical protein C2E23DRAFT_726170 [Lenzites betulinus]|nr:hypothetical protein C2E23DRAFT_726170 [Lenzites betulinus]